MTHWLIDWLIEGFECRILACNEAFLYCCIATCPKETISEYFFHHCCLLPLEVIHFFTHICFLLVSKKLVKRLKWSEKAVNRSKYPVQVDPGFLNWIKQSLYPTFPIMFCYLCGSLDDCQIISERNSLFHYGCDLIDNGWFMVRETDVILCSVTSPTINLSSHRLLFWIIFDNKNRCYSQGRNLISPQCFVRICSKVTEMKRMSNPCFIAGTIIISNQNPWRPCKQSVLF